MDISRQGTAYPWARRYIKGVRVIAALIVVFGLLAMALLSWMGIMRYRSLRYPAGVSDAGQRHMMASCHRNMREDYEELIAVLGETPLAQSSMTRLNIPVMNSPPTEAEELKEIQSLQSELAGNIATLQTAYLDLYCQPIDELVAELKKHVEEVRGKLGEPAVAPPSRHADASESRRGESVRVIYDEPRAPQVISSILRLLADLEKDSKKEDSRRRLATAKDALVLYDKIMRRGNPLQRSVPVDEPAPPSGVPLLADQVMDMLEISKAQVRQEVLKNWKAEASCALLGDLLKIQMDEYDRCNREALISLALSCALILLAAVAALVGAFTAMVVADFMQAIIDTPDALRKISVSSE